MKHLIHIILLSLFFSIAAFADLTVTQGDTATFQLTAETDDDGTLHDLSGAVFTTYLKGPDNTLVTIPDAQHTEDADQVTNKGNWTMSLTAANTLALAPGEKKEILTKVVQGSNVTYFRASILTVKPNVPLK